MEEIIQQVKDGHKNALEVFVELKRSEKEIKKALEQIKNLAYQEAFNNGERVFTDYGAEITMKSGGGSWDYKHLQWYKDAEKLKDRAKLSYKSNDTIVDSDGEIVEAAIYTENPDTISIKL